MKKIVITILALLLAPMIVGAADDALTFESGTNIEVNGITLTVTGLVDDMVVGATTVTFSLSANSSLVVRSNDRYTLVNDLGFILSCETSYSELNIDNTGGSSLILTPSNTICSNISGPSPSSGGGGGVAIPITPTTPTTTTGEVTATSDGGGETTLTTDESTTAAVSLPANAVSVSTNIAIATESKETVTASRLVPSGRSVVGGYVYNFTATVSGATVSSFNTAVTLTFTYTDEQISELNESNLRVFYWKESTSEWVALTTTINTVTNTLTADTTHFTYFAIMGLAEGVGEEEDLVEEAPTITIVDGDLVRNPDAEGMAQFDIYIVKLINNKKFKRLILSPHVFESYEHFDKNANGSPWDDVMDVSQSVMNEYMVSNLVRAVGDSKVYQLVATGDAGTKQWMNMTAARFTNRGHDSDSIYEINETDRNAYATGADITEGEVATSETIIIKISTLRLRSLPSLDGEILTNVSENEVYVLLDEQDGWYKIAANGVTGWCYGGDTGGYAAKQ